MKNDKILKEVMEAILKELADPQSNLEKAGKSLDRSLNRDVKEEMFLDVTDAVRYIYEYLKEKQKDA